LVSYAPDDAQNLPEVLTVKETRLFQGKTVLIASPAHIWTILVSAVLLVFVFNTAGVQADGPNQVGLVVVHGDGDVLTRCIEFNEDEISGYDVLERSELDLNIEPSGGLGVTVCRLDGEGCTFPQQPCFCQCAGGGDCVYWSYWNRVENDWRYSGAGASSHFVGHGDIEGWVWGIGMISGAAPPPAIPFDEICTPPTPTATPTATFTPVPSPTPTDTPKPTSTSRPPIIAYLDADSTTINAGENVSLRWDLSGAEAAYLRYDGTEEGVVAPGNKTVSPATTTVYTLIARNQGGEATAQVTIIVNPVVNTPAATATALATATTPATATPAAAVALSPSVAPSPTQSQPTETATPEQPSPPPADTPTPPPPAEPTQTPVPSPSLSPTMTPSLTATPAQVAAATYAPAQVAAATAVSEVGRQATPPTLLRDVSQKPGPDIPVVVLGGVGVVALLGGLLGLASILLAISREAH
jgi:hypothetical protein